MLPVPVEFLFLDLNKVETIKEYSPSLVGKIEAIFNRDFFHQTRAWVTKDC